MNKSLLGRLSILLGGACATGSLVWNLSNGIDLLTGAFRFALVFFATVIILFIFLNLLASILVSFVAEKVLQQRSQTETAIPATPARPSAARSSVDPAVPVRAKSGT